MDLSASILWSILSQLSCPTFHWRLVLAGLIDFFPKKRHLVCLFDCMLTITSCSLLPAAGCASIRRCCAPKRWAIPVWRSASHLLLWGTGRERIKKRLFMEFTKDSLAVERPHICGSLRALERLLFCAGNCQLRLFGTSITRKSWPTSMNHVQEQAWMLVR